MQTPNQKLNQHVRFIVTFPESATFADVMLHTLAEHMNEGRVVLLPPEANTPQPQMPLFFVESTEQKTNIGLQPVSATGSLPFATVKGKVFKRELVASTVPSDALKVLRNISNDHGDSMSDVARKLIAGWLAENKSAIAASKPLRCDSVFEGSKTACQVTFSSDLRAGLCAATNSVLSKQEIAGLPTERQERIIIARVLCAALSERVTA